MQRLVHSSIRLTVAPVLVIMAIVVWPIFHGIGTPKERAAAWAAAREGSLPSTLSELALYPTWYKEAIYMALPAAQRADLWREYLTRVAASSQISATQRQFLRELSAAIQPDDVEIGAQPNSRLASLLERVDVEMGANAPLVHRGAWRRYELKNESAPVSVLARIRGLRVQALETLIASTVASLAADADCNCNVESSGTYDGCPSEMCCPSVQGERCREMSSGCDLFDNHACNGECCGQIGG